MKREYRIFSGAQVRVRKSSTGDGIEGHAAVFNKLSVDLGGFRERVMPGAFKEDLAAGPDVRCLFNHDPNMILGRTTSRTLRVKEDDQGLHYDCDLPDTTAGRDVKVSLDRGDITGSSFGFNVTKQKWSEEPDPDDSSGQRKIVVREIHAAKVSDVSPVTFPAYPQSDAGVRSLFPDGVPDEIRSHVPGFAETRTAKKTKRVDGEDLTSDCFFWVGDENDPSTWKLPWKFSTDAKTKSHIRNAIARFGQTKGIPAAEKPKVWKEIVAAAKKYDIKVADESSLRALAAITRAEGDDDECQCDCTACESGDCANCSNEDCDDAVCAENGCKQQNMADGDEENSRKMRLELARRTIV